MFMLTRNGTDLQVSLGFSYNSILNNFGVTFMIVPNFLPPNMRPMSGMNTAGGPAGMRQ
jgi:hypothetical protein